MKQLIAVIAIVLSGCATTPFECTTTDPKVCALEKRVYELERKQKQAESDRFMCEQTDDPIFCGL